MRFRAHGVADVRRQLGDPRVFLELPFGGVGLVRLVVGRAAVALRIDVRLDLQRAGRQALDYRSSSRIASRLCRSRDGSVAEMIGRLVASALLMTLPWFVSLARLVALARFALAGLVALGRVAGLEPASASAASALARVPAICSAVASGELGTMPVPSGSAWPCPAVFPMTRCWPWPGCSPCPAALALAGFMP